MNINPVNPRRPRLYYDYSYFQPYILLQQGLHGLIQATVSVHRVAGSIYLCSISAIRQIEREHCVVVGLLGKWITLPQLTPPPSKAPRSFFVFVFLKTFLFYLKKGKALDERLGEMRDNIKPLDWYPSLNKQLLESKRLNFRQRPPCETYPHAQISLFEAALVR